MAAAAVGVAPPPPMPPRVHGPPTLTPRPALFNCDWILGGRRLATPPASAGYADRHPSLWSSTTDRAAIHATTCASAHSPWLAAGFGASDSGDMVPMDGLVGSTVAGQLLQHHDHGPSYDHRLDG
jgi:hypothetical protein